MWGATACAGQGVETFLLKPFDLQPKTRRGDVESSQLAPAIFTSHGERRALIAQLGDSRSE
jgi:hypothetical protein